MKNQEQIANRKREILLNSERNRLFFTRVIVLTASLIWVPFFALCQHIKIEGTITDSNDISLPNTIITASSIENESDIIAFYNSDQNGSYRLDIKQNAGSDSLWLVIRHMAYETLRVKIPRKSLTKNFKLIEKIEELDPVLLKSPKKMRINGDTISYNVKGIKTKKDFTIEEVINRIPGVTISESGQIKYEDQPISHLYINGIDLLESRYNIATQGIPADAVKEIEIMKRHNHERINIGRTESDDVAFNLKIKEGMGLIFGSVKADAGIPLFTGLIEGTPIYLKDSFQNISSFKSNNKGVTLRSVGSNLTVEDLNVLVMRLVKTPIIKPPNTNGIILSNDYWFNNESYAITNDALHKINDSTVFKWNINYVNELSEIQKKSSSIFIVNNDSSVVINRRNNQLKTQRFQGGFNYEINKRNIYIKNNTVIQYSDNSGEEKSIINSNNVETMYNYHDLNINNSTYLKTLISNDKVIHSGLLLEYDTQYEKLEVLPQGFENLFETAVNENRIIQNIKLNKYNLGGFSEYGFNILGLKWNINQRLQYSGFRFKSHLQGLPDIQFQEYLVSTDYYLNRFTSNSKIETKINMGKLDLKWRLSGDYIHLNYNDNYNESTDESKSFLLLQPLASANYRVNNLWNLGINFTEENRISNFTELYPGLILENYNSLVQNPEIINKTKTQSISPFLNYSDIFKSLFFNMNGKISQIKSDVTFVNRLNEDGLIITDVVRKPNNSKNLSFTTNLSKGFLGSFNSNFSYTYSYTENELFFNSDFLKTQNTRHSINLDLSFDNGKWYALEYDARLNVGSAELPNNKIDNLNLYQTIDLDFYTSSSTRLNFSFESSKTSTSTNKEKNNNILFNSSFFYKPSKKTYLRASLTNIFNTSSFTTTNSGVNFVNISQFSLRSRQFTIGFTYSL